MLWSSSIVISLERKVNEYSNHTQKNMYECVDAGYRFVILSNIILKQIGRYSDLETNESEPSVAVWPLKPEGYHFKLERSKKQAGMYQMVSFCLEHYIDDLPPDQSLTRYAVIFNPFMISEITIVDEDFEPKETDSRQGKEAAQQALAILSEMAGKQGDEALNKIFDKRFEELMGRYALSDLALIKEPKDRNITDATITEALVSQMHREIEILDEEGIRSANEDSPAKQTIVSDAIFQTPKINRHGYFVDIDLIRSAKAAHFSIGLLWNNTVRPDQ